jgi:putative peptidoglycan lipid II flippase
VQEIRRSSMIRGLLAFIKNKKALINLLKKTSEFLHPGEYAFDNSLSYIYLKDGWSHKKARELFGTERKLIWGFILYILKVLFFSKSITITHDSSIFDNQINMKGTVCSLGLYRKNLKIFDFTNKKVVTSYLDPADFNETLANYSYFSPFLPLPQILGYNREACVTVEELFTARPVKQWSEDDYSYVINDVFRRYYHLFRKAKSSGSYYTDNSLSLVLKLDPDDRIGLGLIRNIDHSLLAARFPFLKLHGDLWTPNILLRGRQEHSIKYIDLEFTDSFIFFYDIFWLLTDQAFRGNNYYYLNNYLAGAYDRSLKILFRIFGLEFHQENRIDYIRIFYLNFWAERWSHLNIRKRLQHFLQYKRLLKRISEFGRPRTEGDKIHKKGIGRTVLIIMILSILSKVIGFVRDITLSYYYGASDISDVFLMSLTIPSVIFGFIGAGISSGYIPMYNRIVSKSGMEEGHRFTNNLINLLGILCTVIVLSGFVFTQPIVKLFASGFEGETLALAVRFTRVTLFGVYFTGAIYIYNSLLQMNNNYIVPTLVGLPLNIIIISAIVLSYRYSLILLPLGKILGALSEIIFVMVFAYKAGYRYQFKIDMKDEHVKEMVFLSLPVIMGTSINQINLLVDRTIASGITIGGISALEYANRLVSFISSIFVSAFITVLFPKASKMAADKDIGSVKLIISKAVNSICLLTVPASIGAMIFANPIVNMLFGRGAFDAAASSLTADALFFYSIGIAGMGISDVLTRIFYSLHDTKTPMTNAALALAVNILLNVILSKFLGIGGLALATSTASTLCAILLFISLRKKIGPLGIKGMSITFIKALLASCIMGALARQSHVWLSYRFHASLSLIISIMLGAFVYFVMVYMMTRRKEK